jgi:hypothetical protein
MPLRQGWCTWATAQAGANAPADRMHADSMCTRKRNFIFWKFAETGTLLQ